MTPGNPTFLQQHLTPARAAWVLDVGQTTMDAWLKEGQITHYRKGRLIRIAPEALLAFVLANTVRKRGRVAGSGFVEISESDFEARLWARIERLIDVTVTAKVQSVLAVLADGDKQKEAA